MCMCDCMCVCLSVYGYVNLYVCLPLCACLSVCLSVGRSVCMSVNVSRFVCVPSLMIMCVNVHVCMYVDWSVCMSVYVSRSVCLPYTHIAWPAGIQCKPHDYAGDSLVKAWTCKRLPPIDVHVVERAPIYNGTMAWFRWTLSFGLLCIDIMAKVSFLPGIQCLIIYLLQLAQ